VIAWQPANSITAPTQPRTTASIHSAVHAAMVAPDMRPFKAHRTTVSLAANAAFAVTTSTSGRSPSPNIKIRILVTATILDSTSKRKPMATPTHTACVAISVSDSPRGE